MLDAATGPFVMHGARAALAGGLSHIEEQIKSIEVAVVENPGLAFDLARTITESACKAILRDRKVDFAVDADLPRLFRSATETLPLLPPAASGEAEARRSLRQTLGGLQTALLGICELRNAYGFASHGVDRLRPALETEQALLAARTADAIVGYLYTMHRHERPPAASVAIQYRANDPFNAYVDEANEFVRIFDMEYRASEVLFAVDLEAYRDRLATFISEADDTKPSVEDAG